MLLGRDEERLALDRVLAEARDGRSGVLGLVGEPGIGKTSLLQYAASRAEGMRMLRARGIESEAEVPFAGLAELLRPALTTIDHIPSPQARALAGALALAPATARDRFAIGAATLSLLSANAEEMPLALLIDDAHLLDPSSAAAILFAARRFVADPIALVIAAREGEPSLLDGSDLRILRIPGLGRSDAATLLADAKVPADAAERLYAATGGNPLALLELAPEATRVAALPGNAPLPISSSISAAFARRFSGLPKATRHALVLAAAAGHADVALLAQAAAVVGRDVSDLAPAEEARLVSFDGGRVDFVHPLARSAAYADAPVQERRAAHAALASVLPDRDVDARAWHLAAATSGPDEEAARALEQAGERARKRSAYAVAAGAFERAGRLTVANEERGRRLFMAADAAWLAGEAERTLALLDDAALSAADTVVRARIDELRGEVAMRRGPVMDGYPLFVSAADQVADSEPELAIRMLAEAVNACFYSGDVPAMVRAADRAAALADCRLSGRAEFFSAIAQAMAHVAGGDGEAGAAAARRAIEVFEGSSELRHDPRLLAWSAIGPLWLREADVGRTLITDTFEEARGQAAIGMLPTLLHLLGRDQATTDQWAAGEASYGEAIRLARETDQRTELGASLAGLSWLKARQGQEEACRSYAREAKAVCDELGLGLFGVWAMQALGDLELGAGRPVEAIAHYADQTAAMRSLGITDVDLSPGPEVVEARLRLGQRDEAVAEARAYDEAARRKGQPWALARAARCRGLVAADDEFDAEFEDAFEHHARTPDLFERARSALAYGARLRRARRRIDARDHLRAAHETFDRLGAAAWAEQAAAELAATGETARRRDATTLDQLTPQELQIALILGEGKTTREAAAAVFLSPKTVEYHLRHVYRKLGIRSREQLAQAFAGQR